jgi:LCP family protein required for cell wall assembly
MLEFRKKSLKQSLSKKRAVDGFISSNPALDKPQDISSALGSSGKKPDGFSGQDQVNSPFAKALQNHATLPSLDTELNLAEDIAVKKKRTNIRKVLKGAGIGLSAIVICGLLVGGFVFGKAWLAAHKIFKGGGNSSTLFSTDIKPEKLKGEGDGRINILLLGIGGGNHDGADLTDSIVIASIDPVAKDITLLSIPRDLWVSVPNYWSMKINAAYASAKIHSLEKGGTEQQAEDAGFTNLEAVITEYMGIPIHYHALVNFQAFQQGVDAIGGVDVNVPKELSDFFMMGYQNPIIARKGPQHFDGKTALLYAQSRHTTSDFDRGERQRLLLVALKEKLLKVGTFSNPRTVSKLIDTFGNNVSVNATLGEIMRMYEITKDIPSSSIATFGLTDETNPLVTTGTIGDESIVEPRAGLTNFSDIQSFVRNTLRDPFLKSEDASIAILNGTAVAGLATKKADELKSYGYKVTIIDSAPTKDHTTTLIYDKTAGVKKFTKNYLEKRLGASTSKDAAPADILAQADFVVVLGTDANTPSTN